MGDSKLCVTDLHDRIGHVLTTTMAKRVAVIGGGLCGSVASHVLGSRGIKVTLYESAGRLGGKLGGVDKWLRASDSTNPYGQLLSHLETRGVIAPWRGHFGLLISGGAEAPTKFWPVAEGTHLQAPADRDWCGFIGGMAMGGGEGGGEGGGGGGGGEGGGGDGGGDDGGGLGGGPPCVPPSADGDVQGEAEKCCGVRWGGAGVECAGWGGVYGVGRVGVDAVGGGRRSVG